MLASHRFVACLLLPQAPACERNRFLAVCTVFFVVVALVGGGVVVWNLGTKSRSPSLIGVFDEQGRALLVPENVSKGLSPGPALSR